MQYIIYVYIYITYVYIYYITCTYLWLYLYVYVYLYIHINCLEQWPTVISQEHYLAFTLGHIPSVRPGLPVSHQLCSLHRVWGQTPTPLPMPLPPSDGLLPNPESAFPSPNLQKLSSMVPPYKAFQDSHLSSATSKALSLTLFYSTPALLSSVLSSLHYSQVCPWLSLIQTTSSLTTWINSFCPLHYLQWLTHSDTKYLLPKSVILRMLCSDNVSAHLWIPFHPCIKIKASSQWAGGWTDSLQSGVHHSARVKTEWPRYHAKCGGQAGLWCEHRDWPCWLGASEAPASVMCPHTLPAHHLSQSPSFNLKCSVWPNWNGI